MQLDHRAADARTRDFGYVAEQDRRAGQATESLDHGDDDEQDTKPAQARGGRERRGSGQRGQGPLGSGELMPRASLAFRSGGGILTAMSKEQVKAVLDRVLTWPNDRQEDAAKLLLLMESQDQSDYRLTDDQVEEVRRRQADPNPRTLTLEEFKERLSRRLGE